jgi:NADH dehydrogenase
MKVFVTGATGFVGGYILRELLANDHDVTVLVRPGSEQRLNVLLDRVTVAYGDITQPDTLSGKLDGCDAVIHLVGIIREAPEVGITFERIHLDGAKHVIDAAKAAGVKRFILMSANGVKPRDEARSAYQWTKYEAEEYLKRSELEYVIFRPSVVFGKPSSGQPEFVSQLAKDMFGLPGFLPLPLFKEGLPSLASVVKGLFPFARKWQQDLSRNGATFEMQPVAVENVAEAFVKALTEPVAKNKTYAVGGPDRFRWGELLDTISYGLGRRKPRWKMPMPAFFIRILLNIGFLRSLLPISRDQLDMLTEGNVCNELPFFRDFNIKAIRFTPENIAYVGSGAYTPMSTSVGAVSLSSRSRRQGGKWIVYHHAVPPSNTGVSLPKFGMWVFLASEVMFFTGLIGGYIVVRNAMPTWPHPTDLNLGLVASMTFILIMSSMTLVLGLSGVQAGKQGKFKLFLGLTILFGAVFVGLQAVEWNHFLHHHLPKDDKFWAFFYTLTGFHGAHVSLGVIALIAIFVQALRGKYSAAKHNAVEVTGLYWHFVDLVWIILFTILYLF